MSDEQALPLGPEDDQKRLAESSSSFVAPGGDEVGHDRKRKREEKKALKALKREMAAAKKASLPWKLPQPDKGAAEGATGQQGLGSEGAGGNESRRKIRRGWMTRLEEREGEKSIEHIDFSKDFVPQDKDLAAEAPHWDLLRRALRNLQNAAKEMATKPSWAWQVKDAAGKTETPGPVLASVLKEAMKKEALVTDASRPFNEQDLRFRSFGIFLDYAKEHTICLVKCTVHRGNVWVDHKGNEDRLPTLAVIQERDQALKEEAESNAITGVQLVSGKARSRSAKYQITHPNFEERLAMGGGTERPVKLSSWALWDSMGRPKFVCAPMVEQSELAFRLLCRKYGTTLAYTPMFHARLFLEDDNYRREQFTTCPADRPLIVQFCANDPDIFAAAARLVEGQCDAVDLNLGCPQGIAKKGHYGSFLMDDMDLIYKLVNTAHRHCNVPITAKMRVFDDDDKSLQYAKMLQDAGAQIITVHGRTRDNKGATATPADWSIIRKIKQHVSVPVISNGNIVTYEDVTRCLEETQADAVMSAEWLRRNPALFDGVEEQKRDALDLTEEYLELCKQYPCPLGFIRTHCFKLLVQQLNRHPDMRMSFVEAKGRDELKACTTALRQRIASVETRECS